MKSSAVIAPCFYECAKLGREHLEPLPSLLPKIRQVGRGYEELLLKTTEGVNTQRGYLFCAGVLCAAAGYASRLMRTFSEEVLLSLAAKICLGLCDLELTQTRNTSPQTAGERLFQKYGTRGIRGEVEDGFPSVAKFGLPAYREAIQSGVSEDIARIHALITLDERSRGYDDPVSRRRKCASFRSATCNAYPFLSAELLPLEVCMTFINLMLS